MENVFLELFNMSITASWLVLAIVLFRLIFKKAPKWLRVIMWGLVGLRLICPFSFESVLSLIPSAEPVPPEIVHSHSSADVSGAEIFNAIGNNQVYYDLGVQDGSIVFTEYSAPDGDFVNPLLIITYIASIVWIVGMVAMLLYTLISYLRILKNVREATPLKENIWVCDNISTPFILGIIKPRIFLPSSMNEQDTEFVIAHEKAHLKRRDHLWKPFGFALLTVYWFNPVLWVAYILLCRDIELACDEKVIKEMGAEIKKPYSEALINCSVPRKMISACPLAFGETGVKGRIKSVLNYKKPAFWVIIVAVVAVLVTTVCFMTNPDKDDKESTTTTTESTTKEENTTTQDEITTELTTEESTTEESTTKETTTKAYVPTPLVPLSAQKATKIKQDYLKALIDRQGGPDKAGSFNDLTVDDVNIERYYGTYDNCVVLWIDRYCSYSSEGETEMVAGYRFDYGVDRTTDVYRNGKFLTLKEAYEKGWLSKADIRDVHYYHTKENASSKVDLSVPRPALTPLTEEQELKIKQDYLVFNEKSVKRHEDYQNEWYSKKTPEEQKEYREKYNLPDDYVYKMTTDEVYIEEYFGTYNGCSVMMMSSSFIGGYTDAIDYCDVAGYVFVYGSGQHHTIYRNGEFTTLERAYQKGWLTKEDIKNIYYYYSTGKGIYYEVEYVAY